MRFALLLLTASLAIADGIDDRLRTAQALLESEDPASRDKGEAELAAVAVEAGDRLKPLIEHPDAEVRARVAQVLDRAEIIPEEGKTARLRELFEGLAKPGAPDEARLKTVRDILELHPRTPSFIASELAECGLTWVPIRKRVVPTGRVAVEFEATNEGDRGAWVRPSRWYPYPSLKAFGERPGRGSMSAGAAGGVISLNSRSGIAEDAMVQALASMVRVPPKGRHVMLTYASNQTRCGIYSVRAQTMGYSPSTLEATFSGTVLSLPEAGPSTSAAAVRYILAETPGKLFRATAWEDDGAHGLELTALQDVEGLKVEGFDAFWWVELDKDGEFLAQGAFQTDAADLAAWKKGEVRRARMRTGLQADTKTLWMGFTGAGDECVPAPIEVK